MERWHGRTAMVTGAASGIGRAIAERLLAAGVNVVGLDVQIDRLERQLGTVASHGRGYAVKCDVAREPDVAQAFDWLDRNLGALHLLVNCAGVVDYRPLIESDRESFERLMNVNVVGMASCIAKAVQTMRKYKVEGHIFNINSVIGHELPEGALSEQEGSNGWNLYPASKHASVAMTHTVRREIARVSDHIRITSISPGLVKTEITKHNGALKDFFDKVPALDPNDVADAVMYALSTRPEVQITEMTVRRTGEL